MPEGVKNAVKSPYVIYEWSLQFPDVYYVTATEALLWMLEPSDALLTEVTQSCDVNERSKPCSKVFQSTF